MSLTDEKPSIAETPAAKIEPALKLNFISHGTLDCRDIEFSRKFYAEFLGFEVVQTSAISLLIRLGGKHCYAVVKSKKVGVMNHLNHNGIDVRTKEEVDEAHRVVTEQADKWKITKITKPFLQHGTYSFYFYDCDDNCWEILTNPDGGYDWLFENGDMTGKGHHDRNFKRPGVDM